MEFTVKRQHVMFMLLALLFCGCFSNSSQSQSASSGNTQQPEARPSLRANIESAGVSPANPQESKPQADSPEIRLASRVNELATQLASQDVRGSMKTMQQLIALGPDAAVPLWQRLEQASTEDSLNSYMYRSRLLNVLAQLRNPALIRPAFEKLTQPDLDQKIRPRYEAVLKNLRERSRTVIDRLAQHERAEIRESGVRLLADFQDAEAMKALQSALRDESSRVRVHAASGLATSKDAVALVALKELVQGASPEVGAAAAVALTHYDAKTAVPVLAEVLEDPESTIHGAAMVALSEFKDSPEAALVLGKLLENEDPQTRRIASFSLQKMENPEAKTILEQSPSKAPVDPTQEIHLRTECSNQLKRIAVAMHNYHETYGHFPPALGYGPDGKTPHSWRVAILPFMGHAELHKKYNFSEPWDGANNRQLLANMPTAYRCPQVDIDSTHSSYFVLTGATTVFSSSEGTSKQDITDGTDGTLLVVEAVREIPWTKPEDIPYDPTKPLPKLGGRHKGGSYASFANGSVRWIGDNMSETDLRALCTKADP